MPQPDRDERPVDVSQSLLSRAKLLAWQLERDMVALLRLLGELAARAFLAHRHRRAREQDTAELLRVLNLRAWLERQLAPVLKNHARRTILDTQRTLTTEVQRQLGPELSAAGIAIDLHAGPVELGRIINQAGSDLRLPDLERQAREAIIAAIEEGYAAGENPVQIARRIRAYVPAGRFVHAGAGYRARLIARTETLNLQRAVTLAAYDSEPQITGLLLRDGLLPDSDDFCRGRDGTIVPKSAPPRAAHPQCTLSYSPIVSLVPVTAPEPVLAGTA